MLFPIIKLKSGITGRTRLVGTDPHGELIITGDTIEYYNLQCGDNGEYEFAGEDGGHLGTVVEFVEFEELKEIYEKHKKDSVEHNEWMKKMFGVGVDDGRE